MRYQRVSPDCVHHVSNGRKSSNLRSSAYKEDEGSTSDSGRIVPSYSFDRYNNRQDHPYHNFIPSDSPTSTPQKHHESPSPSPSPSPSRGGGGGGGGDVLLQWGQKKRSRGSRAVGDESSFQSRQIVKLHRRVMPVPVVVMPPPPPPPPPPSSSSRGGGSLRSYSAAASVPNDRKWEERSSGGRNGSSGGGRVAAPSRSATENKMGGGGGSPNGSAAMPTSSVDHQEASHGGGEKLNLDAFEWPRIYVSLSRKEKEDDFYAMKGTKLPQRPRKRAKNVDKTLQYCFPGMWLSDLTRGRYEVREKKCVKKQKRRGLKGMESVDSDSE